MGRRRSRHVLVFLPAVAAKATTTLGTEDAGFRADRMANDGRSRPNRVCNGDQVEHTSQRRRISMKSLNRKVANRRNGRRPVERGLLLFLLCDTLGYGRLLRIVFCLGSRGLGRFDLRLGFL